METPLPDPIRNRVDESGLIALDLDQLAPKANVRSLDLSAYLEQGLILREKPFRTAMAELNAADWDGSTVALHCASDAILPDWAWMLATSKLTALGARVCIGDEDRTRERLLLEAIEALDLEPYRDGRLVIKGCAQGTTAESLARVIQRLQPVALSIFYGEPCSTVPVYKRPKN